MPSLSLRSESASIITSKLVLIAFAVIFYSLLDVADSNPSCYVGEIKPDSSGKVDISNIKTQLTIQSCSSPTPRTTQKPAISSTTTAPSTITNATTPASPTPPTNASITPSSITPSTVNIMSVTPSTVNTPSVAPSTVNTTSVTPSTVNPPSVTPSTVSHTSVAPTTTASNSDTNSSPSTPVPSASTQASTPNATASPSTTTQSTTQSFSATTPNKTAPPAITTPTNMAPTMTTPAASKPNNSHTSTSGSEAGSGQRRMKRLAAVSKKDACQVTWALVGGSKVTADTSWKAVFQCTNDEADCKNDTSSTNKTYCCPDNKCNSMSFLKRKKADITFSTVDSCFTGTSEVASSSCGQRNYVCTNVTRTNGTISYHCGSANISRHCLIEDYKGLPQQGCYSGSESESEGIALVCCCGSNDCNKQQMMPGTTQHGNKALIGGIVAAFLGGLVIGGILIALYKRKKGGPSAQPGELLSFNYKRMSADDCTEEIDLTMN